MTANMRLGEVTDFEKQNFASTTLYGVFAKTSNQAFKLLNSSLKRIKTF